MTTNHAIELLINQAWAAHDENRYPAASANPERGAYRIAFDDQPAAVLPGDPR